MIALLILLALILLNGVFAMAEIAVVSARVPRLRHRADLGDRGAIRALELAAHPNRFLATVQIGITLVGVFAGAFGGATLSAPLADRLRGLPVVGPAADGVAFALVVTGITYLSLVLGELVPKRVGLNDPERIASRVAGAMHGLSRLATPLVQFLSASTNLVLRVIRVRPPLDPGVSEDEIEGLVEEGRRAGVVEPAEQEIIGNAFWLGERRTIAITTPRTALAWLDADATPEDVLRLITGARHTRYLVCEGEVDRFLGFVHTRTLLAAQLAGEPLDLRALARKPLVVPETLPVLALLEQFKQRRVYLAVVVDEYGGVAGITTLSDILEELVGEVPGGAGERSEITPLPGGGWSVDGLLDLGEAVERLGLGRGEEMVGSDVNTVGGFVTRRLERVPRTGDAFTWRGHRFEVRSMVGLRVARVTVTPEPAATGGDTPAGRPGGGVER